MSDDGSVDAETLIAHAGFIRSVAGNLVADENSIDDVTQQAYLTALEHPPRHDGSLRAWCAVVTANVVRTWRRQEARRARREVRVARDVALPSASDLAERRAVIRDVAEAVYALDEPYRTAILLRYYDERTPTEIARSLDLPLDTVKTRLRRGRERLRARLDELHGSRRDSWSGALAAFLGGGAAGSRGTVGASEPAQATCAPVPSFPAPSLPAAAGDWSHAVRWSVAAVVLTSLGWLFLLMRTDSRERSSETARRSQPTVVATGFENGSAGPGRTGSLAPATGRNDADGQGSGEPRTPDAVPGEAVTGALLVRVVWDVDGTPAVGVRARIEPSFTSLPTGPQMRYVADEQGRILARALSPGLHSVTVGRTATSIDATVQVGERSEVEMRLARGADVSGMVTDAEGRCVADAAIVLIRYPTDPGYVVARTRRDGRFRIRDLSVGCWLGARHERLRPSPLTMLLGWRVGDVRLDFALGSEGASIGGIVHDPQGRPVSGARVWLGTSTRGTTSEREDGSLALEPASPQTRTDRSGQFRFDAIETGPVKVVADDGVHALAHADVDARPGHRHDVDLQLDGGTTLRGIVLDEAGEVVAGSVVRVSVADLGAMFAPVEALSGGDGEFEVTAIPSGRLWLEAAHERAGKADVAIDARGAGELRWEARLSVGNCLEGVVIGADDRGLEGWTVTASGLGDMPDACPLPHRSVVWHDSVRTDGAGCFTLRNCPDRALRIALLSPESGGGGGGVIVLERFDLRAGDRDVLLRVTEDSIPSATLVGHVLPAAGTPVAGVRVMVHRLRDPFPQRFSTVTAADGSFSIAPLPAGRFVIAARHERWNDAVLETVDIAAGEECDAGRMIMGEPGRLVARYTLADLDLVDRPDVRVYDVFGMPVHPVTLDDGIARSQDLEPGDYTLRVQGIGRDHVAAAMIPFEIRAGAVSEVLLELRRGVPRTLVAHEPAVRAGHAQRIRFLVHDSHGAPVWEAVVRRATAPRTGESFRTRLYLVPGVYTVTAATDTGLRSEAALAVSSVDDPAETVRFDLR